MPKISSSKQQGRAGVRAAREFFESNNCVFQEINLENDYGKDAYIDFSVGSEVKGWCCAVQIRSGKSFQTEAGYKIDIDDHEEVWRESTLPIIGIVHDPSNRNLYWCDITEYLRKNEKVSSSIPVSRAHLLTAETLESELKPTVRKYADATVALTAAANIFSDNESTRVGAVIDCVALGTSDDRPMAILRGSVLTLSGEALRAAIEGLTFYSTFHLIETGVEIEIGTDKRPNRSIQRSVRQKVEASFTWTVKEIEYLITSVPAEEWTPYGIGASVFKLLQSDASQEYVPKLEEVVRKCVREGNDYIGGLALEIYLNNYAEEGPDELKRVIDRIPEIERLSAYPAIKAMLDEAGEMGFLEPR